MKTKVCAEKCNKRPQNHSNPFLVTKSTSQTVLGNSNCFADALLAADAVKLNYN